MTLKQLFEALHQLNRVHHERVDEIRTRYESELHNERCCYLSGLDSLTRKIQEAFEQAGIDDTDGADAQ